MQFASLPLLERLGNAQRVLVAGCGGGYDVYAGLPLYFYLRKRVEAIFLANLSFADLPQGIGRQLTPALTEIDADTEGPEDYFPERALCRWFRGQGQEISVFCFKRTGVVTLRKAWEVLAEKLALDTVILADGGTDSLMRGDEIGLGTPQEDLASIACVHFLKLPRKILTCLGFGVDTFDGVCHSDFLEATAALQKKGAFLGAFSLLPQMEESQLFLQAVEHASQMMPACPSVVASSIASAVEGEFGDYHKTWRTKGNQLFISPLMSMYWSYDVDAVARRCLYLKEIAQTKSYKELDQVVKDFRKKYPPHKTWRSIPY